MNKRLIVIPLLGLATSLAGPAQMQSTGPQFELVDEAPWSTDRASTGGISWVDYDGDGDDDAFVANGYDVSTTPVEPQENRLYENIGGSFVARPSRLSTDAGFSSGSAWADFDNDGLIDAFVPNQRDQTNLLYRNLGAGSFALLADAPPSVGQGSSFAATWGDVDNDGFVDLFVANGGLSGAEPDFLYRNNEGVFEAETTGPVVTGARQSGGGTFVDYDLDGDLDLFVAGAPTRMFRNTGAGAFEVDAEVPFARAMSGDGQSRSGAWTDFDNDGDYDLFQVFRGGAPSRMFVNVGDGRFRRAELGEATRDLLDAFHALWSDLDNDGFQDLVVANWGGRPRVYRSRAARTFDAIECGELRARDWFASMVACSDFDLDGAPDLAVGNWPAQSGEGETNLLYRNQGPSGNFLALRLVGTRSNRSAIGARVEVRAAGRTQVRDVRSQDGWRSQSSLELLFGLGTAEKAESVRVLWPSGGVQEEGPLFAGTRRTIVELPETGGDATPWTAPQTSDPETIVRAEPPPYSELDVRVDARTRPGSLVVSGTIRLAAARSTEDVRARFRLLANARDLAVGTVSGEQRFPALATTRVGSFGGGLDAIHVWEVVVEEAHAAEDRPTLWFTYTVTGTQEIFHVEDGLAFASGLNLPWYPQDPSTNRAVGRVAIEGLPGSSAVAAGRRTSTAEEEAAGHFHFELEQPLSPSFALGTWDVTTHAAGALPVRMFRSAPHPKAAEQARELHAVIEILEREFGAYPYSEFSVVEIPAATANRAGFGGVSLDGWIIAPGPAWANELSVCFFGHEISHQWWGNQVRSENGAIPDGLIDEGLANYGGHVVFEELKGVAMATRHRQFGCDLLGWETSALGYFAQVAAGEDQRLDRIPNGRAGEWLKDNKLSFVWLELRRVLGREGMRTALHEFYRRHAGGTASFEDVVAALETGVGETPVDVRAVLDQWMCRPGAPELRLEWKQSAGVVHVVLTQSEPTYFLDVPLRVHMQGGATLDAVVSIDGRSAELELRVDAPVWTVELDPEYRVLHATPELRLAAEPLGYYLRGLNESDLELAVALLEEGLLRVPSIDLHAARMFLEYALGSAYADRQDWSMAKAHFLTAVQSPSRRPDFLPYVYLHLAKVAIGQRDRDLFDWSLEAVEASDRVAGRVTSAPTQAARLRFPGSGAGD